MAKILLVFALLLLASVYAATLARPIGMPTSDAPRLTYEPQAAVWGRIERLEKRCDILAARVRWLEAKAKGRKR